MSNPVSYNKLIVEQYTKEGLRPDVRNGFAHLSQKIKSKGLKVLADAYIAVGNQSMFVPAGSLAHVREETLHNQQWAAKVLESEEIAEPFLVIDVIHVDFISYPEGVS